MPGDKSVSHRALILGALSIGETTVTGLSQGEDVQCTAAALGAMGAEMNRGPEGTWTIEGRGVGGLTEPEGVLDLGNSGTGARLLMGVAAHHAFPVHFCGDASLSSRPMKRIMTPLSRMGAQISAREGGRLPLSVSGSHALIPIEYRLPVPSAQIKSAVLLAGIGTAGTTAVVEAEPSRDHTEHMLRHFGAEVSVTDEGGLRRIELQGQPELRGARVNVPGDPSQAAFAVVAALLIPGAEVVVENVCVSALRDGLFVTLREMGADIEYLNERLEAGEPVADIRARHGTLKGVTVPPRRAPAMIDEYPILAVAAAFAHGATEMRGLAELRVKESDRLAVMAAGLKACGVALTELDDGLIVEGGNPPAGGATVASHLDHRIAMSFLIMGMAAANPVAVDDARPIDTSFPGFSKLFNGLGANIESIETESK